MISGATLFGTGSCGAIHARVRAVALFALIFVGTDGTRSAQASVVASAAIVPDITAATPRYGHARIVERRAGEPVFEVDHKPFFVYGAAFFYERLPREQWEPSMRELAAMGINTLDLYVPWNWHELADGDFDFDGRTSPRRDLHEVLRLARDLHFEIILRPGPVIRNEWRNGGYPAWLLERPEYGMPLHDVLEGRYPATATLQNAHSDDAAAEWMRNATHMHYATRWLQRVLHESAFVADRIIAVALDDDQGAYIDNQTYPAPHLRAYLEALRDVVHGVTGPEELTFINTYQMKVTSSSPVWAMGNWYQSDAYSIGEHDRAQLEFSTALLHTRPHQPLMASEFQAGWLEGPGDVRPRPADPSNTILAMTTMIGAGVRGIVNFPAQDTLYPTGWEAPFANGFYAWDAALGLDGTPSTRYAPTARIGALVRAYGPQLASAQTRYDAAIAYLGGSYAEPLSNDAYGKIAAATIVAQQACRAASLTCGLVDLSATSDADLARYPLLLIPDLGDSGGAPPQTFGNTVTDALARYAHAGGRVRMGEIDAEHLARVWGELRRPRSVEGMPGASFAPALQPSPGIARRASSTIVGFLSVPNYSDVPLIVNDARIATSDGSHRISPFVVPARDGLVAPVRAARFASSGSDSGRGRKIQELTLVMPPPPLQPTPGANASPDSSLPIRNDAPLPLATPFERPIDAAKVYASDVYAEGRPAIIFDNGLVRVVVAPEAGARAFVFEDDATGRNVFTSVGALRDDVALEPPLSPTDHIAKYTHQFPAGTFNRPYATSAIANGPTARATFSYDAPDVVPNGAHFERTLTLAPGARAFDVDERATFAPGPRTNAEQRAVSVTSLSVGEGSTTNTRRVIAPDVSSFVPDTTIRVTTGHALGFYDTQSHELATIAWRAGDVEAATILELRYSLVARLTLARKGAAHLRFASERSETIDGAREAIGEADRLAQTSPM